MDCGLGNLEVEGGLCCEWRLWVFGVEFWEKAGRWSEGLDARCWVWIGEEFGIVWRLEGGLLLGEKAVGFFRGRRRDSGLNSHALSLVLSILKRWPRRGRRLRFLIGGRA